MIIGETAMYSQPSRTFGLGSGAGECDANFSLSKPIIFHFRSDERNEQARVIGEGRIRGRENRVWRDFRGHEKMGRNYGK